MRHRQISKSESRIGHYHLSFIMLNIMHLKFFFLLLLIPFGGGFFAQNNIPKPTHYIVQSSYSSNIPLSNSEQQYIFFDANGYEIQSNMDTWNGTAWVPFSRTNVTNDAAGKVLERTVHQWDAGTLKMSSRTIFEYNAAGLTTLQNHWEASPGSTVLEEKWKFITTYTAANQEQSVIRVFYQNGAPSFGSQTLTTYDAQNRVDAVISQNLQPDGSWRNSQRRNHIYNDPDNRADRVDIQNWNTALAAWDASASYEIITYQPFVTTTEAYNIVNGVATISTKNTTVYNSDQQITVHNTEIWDNALQGLKLSNGFDVSYNPNKSQRQYRSYYRDFQTGVYFQSLQIDYDYGLYTSVKNTPALPEVQVFPNPVSDILQVQWASNATSQPANLALTDAKGNLIASATGQQESATFSLANQPCGLYFVQVVQGNGVRVVPVVKQ